MGLTEERTPDGGEGGLRLRKDHREDEEEVGTRDEEEEEKEEEEDLEDLEGKKGCEPACPLEKLNRAQTSSSNFLTSL